MLKQSAVFGWLLLVVALDQSLPETANAGEKAATIYRSRYILAGLLTRAGVVCGNNNQHFRHFIDAGFSLLRTPELKAFSKAYPRTSSQWLKAGAERLNEKVMADGIPEACAFAFKERQRAEAIAKTSVRDQSASAGDSAELEYKLIFKGTCEFKFLNRTSFLSCDQNVTFENFKTRISVFTFTVGNSDVFKFSGGTDRQPNLENYYLNVDTAKFGKLSGMGVQGEVEGECHMRMNKDGSEFYEIKCDVFDRKADIMFNFYLKNIISFEKKDS